MAANSMFRFCRILCFFSSASSFAGSLCSKLFRIYDEKNTLRLENVQSLCVRTLKTLSIEHWSYLAFSRCFITLFSLNKNAWVCVYDWPIAQCFFIALQHNIAWIDSIAGAWIVYSCFVRLLSNKIKIKQKQTNQQKKKRELVFSSSAECERSFISNHNGTRENKELYKRIVSYQKSDYAYYYFMDSRTILFFFSFSLHEQRCYWDFRCVRFSFNSHDSFSFAHNRDE